MQLPFDPTPRPASSRAGADECRRARVDLRGTLARQEAICTAGQALAPRPGGGGPTRSMIVAGLHVSETSSGRHGVVARNDKCAAGAGAAGGAAAGGCSAALGRRDRRAAARGGAGSEPGRRRQDEHSRLVSASAGRARGGGATARGGAGFRAPDDRSSGCTGRPGGRGGRVAGRPPAHLGAGQPRRAGTEAGGSRTPAR